MIPTKYPVTPKAKNHKTIFCWAYQNDLDQAYAFYCARYENIKYEDFLKLGYLEFKKKLNSIPENEPLFKIIKSRTIRLNTIKDTESKKYWEELKRLNKIPDIYLSSKEIFEELKSFTKEKKGL